MHFNWQRSLLLLSALLAGCSNTLETGYTYHPLNASDSDRRAYYAPAFSPESQPEKAPSGAPDLMNQHH
jgi:hypothetical protein